MEGAEGLGGNEVEVSQEMGRSGRSGQVTRVVLSKGWALAAGRSQNQPGPYIFVR